MRSNKVMGIMLILILILSLFPLKIFATESVNSAQFYDMCKRTDEFMDLYQRVPQIIYTDTDQTNYATAAEFYYMMARWLRFYKQNGRAPNTVTIVRDIGAPPSPTGAESGTIYQSEMLSLGEANANFIDSNNRLPNYTQLSDGTKVSPEAFFWCMARTIRFYNENGRLPNYTTVLNAEAPNSWTGTASNPSQPPSDPYPWSRTLTVPYTAQPDGYTCGPTSLRMVMAYFGTWYSVSTIANYMASIGDSPYYDGVAPDTIVTAAKHYGFSGATVKYGWDVLKNYIASGEPVIAHLYISANNYPRYYPSNSPAYSSYTGGHYVVVVGLKADDNGNVLYVVVHDPAKGDYVKYTASSFDSAWSNKSRRLVVLH